LGLVHTKTDFYLALQSEIEKVPKHDVTIVMGDLSAKAGNDNTGNERVMGRYDCGNINDNGERLVDLCGTNNLVIGGITHTSCNDLLHFTLVII
jgi:hypothetical protein